jgi:8-oxo-dGTP pyrophosphatase MutT (NUDIX family)
MKVIHDKSYGVVPLYVKDGLTKVLLVHQISYRGDRFWIFPKGHAEVGESALAAALRELQEETGVTEITLDGEKVFSVAYSFVHDGERIEKEVDYYLGYCDTKETNITQPREVAELKWCSLEEAAQLLTHQNSKDVLQQVRECLKI